MPGWAALVAAAAARDACAVGSAIDDSRLKAERGAFRGLLSEYDKLWRGVVREHATAHGQQLSERG